MSDPGAGDGHEPFLSVVIPALDEEFLLERCLTALDVQDYSGGYEVVVVDNGSTDATATVARAHGARVVHEPRRGTARARRTGFADARGDVIVSTDADCVAPAEWLSNLAAAMADPEIDGVVGGFTYVCRRRGVRLALRVLMPVAFGVDRLFGGHFSEANFALRRHAYRRVGGFRIGASEGIDLTRRLRAAGFRLRVDHRLRVETSGRRFDHAFARTVGAYVRNWLYIGISGRQYPRPLASYDPVRLSHAG